MRPARVAARQTTLKTVAKIGLPLLALRLFQLHALCVKCLWHGRHIFVFWHNFIHGGRRILRLSILVILRHRLIAASQLNWIIIRVLADRRHNILIFAFVLLNVLKILVRSQLVLGRFPVVVDIHLILGRLLCIEIFYRLFRLIIFCQLLLRLVLGLEMVNRIVVTYLAEWLFLVHHLN